MLRMATVIANEALKVITVTNALKDSLDFLPVKHAVVMKKEPLVLIVITVTNVLKDSLDFL